MAKKRTNNLVCCISRICKYLFFSWKLVLKFSIIIWSWNCTRSIIDGERVNKPFFSFVVAKKLQKTFKCCSRIETNWIVEVGLLLSHQAECVETSLLFCFLFQKTRCCSHSTFIFLKVYNKIFTQKRISLPHQVFFFNIFFSCVPFPFSVCQNKQKKNSFLPWQKENPQTLKVLNKST